MKAITFRLRLLEPVLVAQAESGEEDSAVGRPFIPGSALRGALVKRYLRARPLNNLATDDQARQLFLDGAICFLNAYPWREEERLLPRPMSWFAEKDETDRDEGPVYDWAVDPDQRLENPKLLPDKFCLLTNGSVALYLPPRQINVHIALINANRRGDENKVYRYDALAEGELLAGAIVAESDTDLGEIEKLLTPGEMQIGAAHTAGYGRVKIEEPSPSSYWEEYAPADDPADGQTIVTLLSDAILRGENGQVDGDLNAALAAKLGRPDLKPLRTYRRLRLVGGFNRKWSLPLAQSWALQAGSVYVYPAGAIEPAALRKLARLGIGERRAEGFGRLAVNWHTQPEPQRREIEAPISFPPPLSEESKKLARQMAQRRLRLLLDRKLAEAVNVADLRPPRPQNTQLSRMRNAVQRARAKDKPKLITDHLDDLKDAREQFERARVERTPLLRWIKERVSKMDVDKQLLQSDPLPQIAGEEAELTEELKVEYTARLIDGVMKKGVKQNQNQEGSS